MYIYRQFTRLQEGFGANKGDTVQFTKRLRIDTRGGTLTETTTMPRNTIKFVKSSVTVNEYGNAVDYTGKLEDLAEFNVRDQFAAGLVDDQKDTLDRAVQTQMTGNDLKATASTTATTATVTTGTATVTASANPSDKNLRDIVDELDRRQTPLYEGGNFYMGILSVNAMRGVYDFLQAVAQYADPEFRFTNEVGQYYSCRMIKDRNILPNNIGLNSAYGAALFFGDDVVLEAVSVPEELRYQETDVGRSKTLAWYAILGFQRTWDLSSDDLNSTGNGVERIIHLTSA